MSSVVTVTDPSFEEDVLESDTPILVDFWAEWCGPCKMLGPILEDIAPENEGKIVISKLDIDNNPGTPAKYGVRGIPTMLIFKNGEVVGTKVGVLSKSQLQAFIDENV